MPIELQLGNKPQPLDPAAEREKRRKARFWTTAACIVCVLSFVTVLRLYAYEFTLVVSGSMEKTLFKGDYAIFDHRVSLRDRWNRGDIVIFNPPRSWESGGQEGDGTEGNFGTDPLVKRVIGLPGELIYIRDGDVYINSKKLNESYLKEQPDPQGTFPLQLGPGQYFVMGDNRNNSDDSRNNGPISEHDIKGRVTFKLWPLSRAGGLPTVDYGDMATNN